MKPKEIIKLLKKEGFIESRQGKGSHVFFDHPDGRRTMVAMHNKDVTPGTLRKIERDIGYKF